MRRDTFECRTIMATGMDDNDAIVADSCYIRPSDLGLCLSANRKIMNVLNGYFLFGSLSMSVGRNFIKYLVRCVWFVGLEFVYISSTHR